MAQLCMVQLCMVQQLVASLCLRHCVFDQADDGQNRAATNATRSHTADKVCDIQRSFASSAQAEHAQDSRANSTTRDTSD
jgi:hypothetical protein